MENLENYVNFASKTCFVLQYVLLSQSSFGRTYVLSNVFLAVLDSIIMTIKTLLITKIQMKF